LQKLCYTVYMGSKRNNLTNSIGGANLTSFAVQALPVDSPRFNCLYCGNEFTPKKNGRHQKFCKSACRGTYWKNHNKLKNRAHRLVYKAIKRGTLNPNSVCKKCDLKCKTEAHHADYNKPLEVSWLCGKCHRTFHHSAQAENPPPKSRSLCLGSF